MGRVEHRYQVGEVVNETLKIVSQLRMKDGNNKSTKAYEVQSLVYPDAPTYTIKENKLNRGTGCGYKAGKRVYEGNSLYSIKHIRPYLKNIEESKKILPNSTSVYVVLQCSICKTEKKMRPNNIMHRGFKCLCNNNLSFPELFFISYIESLNLKFKPQQIMKNLKNHRFDFVDYENKIIVETHGSQHYNKSSTWYKRTRNSDISKRKWCEENGYVLVELDCRKSEFEFIKNNINKNNYLPGISKIKEKEILEIMKKNKKYPIKTITEMYKNGKSIVDIAEQIGLKKDVVLSVLKKMNIEIRYAQHYLKKKVKCINTNETFLCLEDAKNWCGLVSRERISSCALGKVQSAGKHPVTGEKLYWEYVDNE